MTAKVPTSATGTAMIGNEGGAQVAEEDKDDDGDQHKGLDQGLDHLWIVAWTKTVVSYMTS